MKKNKFKNENLWYNEELFGSYADTIISAGMAKNIIRENDYEKDTLAALYICGRYENAPDRIFTGKVSAPEGEWTIDASDGVTKAEVTFSLSDRGEHEEWVLLLRSHWKNYYVRVGDETIYHRNGKRDGSAVMSS